MAKAPEGTKSLGTPYFTTSLGVGNFRSSVLLSTVSDITKKNGSKGWIQDNLTVSHLDHYHAFFATPGIINLFFFIVVSKFYTYNTEVMESEIEPRK